jgi:hypothetical protein
MGRPIYTGYFPLNKGSSLENQQSSMGRLIYMSVYQTPQRDLTGVSFAMLPSNEGLYLYGE